MSRYEATFTIDSKSDSYAVQRILEQVYDTIREESRHITKGTDDASQLLRQFKIVRDEARRPTAGKLTIAYERYDDEFSN